AVRALAELVNEKWQLHGRARVDSWRERLRWFRRAAAVLREAGVGRGGDPPPARLLRLARHPGRGGEEALPRRARGLRLRAVHPAHADRCQDRQDRRSPTVFRIWSPSSTVLTRAERGTDRAPFRA